MRLPNSAHTSRPWRIHELTAGFRLEDVWALPTPGGQADFPRLVQQIAAGDPAHGSSRGARTLWAIRRRAGELLRWDSPDAGVGSRVPTLRDRLPADLRDGPPGPEFAVLPFRSLYLTGDMAAIAPFRHLIVYPRMLRELGQSWRRPAADRSPRHPQEAR